MTAVAVTQQAEPPAKPRLKLYEATSALDAAYALLEASEGELTPEIEEALEKAGATFDGKAENVALMVRELEADAAAEKAQAEAIAQVACAPHLKRASVAANAAKGLKAYLLRELVKAGDGTIEGARKVKGERVSIRVQKNGQPSVKVVGVDAMNMGDFTKRLYESASAVDSNIRGLASVKVEYVLDTKRAVELHKTGAELPPEIVIETGAHVRIS